MNTNDKLAVAEILAMCLDEWGHHQAAESVRKGEDLESYEEDIKLIRQLRRFGVNFSAAPAPAVGDHGNIRNVIEAAFNLSMHVNIPEITPNIDGTITFEWETDAGVALLEVSHDSYSFLMKTKKGERFTDTGRLDSAANIAALGGKIQGALYQNQAVGGDGMLPDALAPHAKEWYRLCERRSYVDRMTISGPLAQAIVEAVDQTPLATQGDARDAELLDWVIENSGFKVQGKGSSWHVFDCRNGLTFLVRNAPTARDAIKQAIAAQAAKGGGL